MEQLYCLGDSLTFGFGVSRQERWTNLVEKQTGIRLVNLGCNGDTTGGMLARLQRDVLSDGAAGRKGVLLMGGSNDIFYSGQSCTARSNMGAMIQQIMAAGMEVVVGIPLPIVPTKAPEKWAQAVDFESAVGELEQYAAWLKKFSQAFSVEHVDFRADFLQNDATVKEGLLFDGLHPNQEGHRLMANRLAAFLNAGK